MLEFELIASCESKYRGASISEGVRLRGNSNSLSPGRDRESRRRATTTSATPVLLRRRARRRLSVGTRPRCVYRRQCDDASLVRAVSTRRRARGPRAGASVRARWRGFFPPFLPSRPAIVCPVPALRVTCALHTLPDRFRTPSRCCARLASRPALAHAASARPSPRRRSRHGSSNIAPGSPPPARHTCRLYRPEINVVTVNVITINKIIRRSSIVLVRFENELDL